MYFNLQQTLFEIYQCAKRLSSVIIRVRFHYLDRRTALDLRHTLHSQNTLHLFIVDNFVTPALSRGVTFVKLYFSSIHKITRTKRNGKHRPTKPKAVSTLLCEVWSWSECARARPALVLLTTGFPVPGGLYEWFSSRGTGPSEGEGFRRPDRRTWVESVLGTQVTVKKSSFWPGLGRTGRGRAKEGMVDGKRSGYL